MVCFIKILVLISMIIIGICQKKQEDNIKTKAYVRKCQDIIDYKPYRPIDEYIAEERRKANE